MVPVLVAAAVAAAGGAAYYVYKHWDEVKAFFSNFLSKLKVSIAEKMRGIANAAVIVGEKIRDGIAQLKHKLFYKEEGKWMEETTKREVTEDEVPPYIRAKIARQEADITQEMEMELGMSV
ncbi:MAG: hypothetical protein IJL14_09660 [Selenomonadaceae bacterium]|nr:hypothetical protein [Selenomonadaceae bacterium]MBQ6006496.1 hypothetical protein [Selenomonadaceae bacterium]